MLNLFTRMDSYGLTWTLMGQSLNDIQFSATGTTYMSNLFTRMDSYGLTWTRELLNLFTRLDSSGLAWTRLDSLGLFWTHLDSSVLKYKLHYIFSLIQLVC